MILDADAQLKKDTLLRLFSFVFEGSWSAVQLRKSVINISKNFLTTCQSMEMAMDAIFQYGRLYFAGVSELRGNGQLINKEVLLKCGSFNEHTVTDDLVNFSKAQNAVSAIAFKLQDEYNDAESKKLYNEFYSELETNTNNYLNTQGFDAVKVVDKENNETAYDQSNNNITDLLASYSDRASNGEIKYMFENKEKYFTPLPYEDYLKTQYA